MSSRIIIAGDLCLQGSNASMSLDTLVEGLSDVSALLKEVDFSIVNLETAVTSNGNAVPISKSGPAIMSDTRVLQLVKRIGFSGVTLANNHFADYGSDVVNESLSYLKQQGLWYVGAGQTEKNAAETKYFSISNKKVAVINCCEHEFTIAEEANGGCNPLNPIAQYYAITNAKVLADYVLVIVHGGHEHYQLPSPRMQETYRFFIDAGADVVINHHQHCYSGYEVYKGKPIFYGLGNFLFGWKEKAATWYEGYMVELELLDEIGFRLIAYSQNSSMLEGNANDQMVCLFDEKSKAEFEDNLKTLNSIIADSDLLREHWLEMAKCRQKEYLAALLPCKTRWMRRVMKVIPKNWQEELFPVYLTEARVRNIQNLFQCEAHNEIMRVVLKCYGK